MVEIDLESTESDELGVDPKVLTESQMSTDALGRWK